MYILYRQYNRSYFVVSSTWSPVRTRNMMSSWLRTPLTQRVSSMYNRYVDSPSGDPENEPELANETEDTTGGRGATIIVL